RHLMGLVSFANGCALPGSRVHQLGGQLLGHRMATGTVARRIDQPAHGQRRLALTTDLYRYLIRRAADPPRLDLDHRRRRTERLLEDLDRIAFAALFDDVERLIDNVLGDAALAIPHHAANQARNVAIVALWVRPHDPMRNLRSTRHVLDSSYQKRQTRRRAPET